ESKYRFIYGLLISTRSRIGVLSDVAAVLAASKVNVHELSARDLNDGFGMINAMVDVAGVAQLDNIMNRLKGIKGILDVTRTVDTH
ncbi:MAG: ACT domain-containing protein, partial [Eubacteriales bacterium]|nr:ACT domain-containing protein [Eubacteriales bacterium]